ncbi:regulatory protein TetR [Catenulispora acidiphila DSM 44928]|uniref:Regulatory protein TetR n=1 Tax=Catenulispora acidiphila (strain DSM 44928 / JCM 14897 / NBRC 102108 / NRRL B-24433 / ID139908) TaxID=479433 RepID=C7QCF3_CATAD|nr:regulatory protein TetR [Catenulispora acidiphila DSM 44928]
MRRVSARISILEAAERRFAEDGIEAVSLRQIAAESGQRNTSAVAYHFGTRAALVGALYEHRMAPINARRLEFLDAHPDAGVATYVRALVEPLAETLTDAEKAGRPSWYLRFLAEAMRYPEYDPASVAVALERPEASSIRALISGLQTATAPLRLPPGVFAERMRLLALLVITSLADRERHPGTGVGTETLIAAGAAILADGPTSTHKE